MASGILNEITVGDAAFSDFAGSTIVHSAGGWAALMGAYFLGPRLGKYDENGNPRAIPGHNIVYTVIGVFILWFGWFGFNPGSELAADNVVVRAAVTTLLAAAAGGCTAALTIWLKTKRLDVAMSANGVLAGLVSITAGTAAMTPLGAVITGAIGGVIVVFSVIFFDRIRIDDPVGAISVHGMCGVWGTLAVGLFATYDDAFLGRERRRPLLRRRDLPAGHAGHRCRHRRRLGADHHRCAVRRAEVRQACCGSRPK